MEFDMAGAEIIAEGDSWIVCKKLNGKNVFIDFQDFSWARDEDGKLIGGITNLETRSDMQELIDAWTGNPF